MNTQTGTQENRNIAIMGAGAIGSVIGGMLARQGHRVTLIGRQPHMEAVSEHGLFISGIWGEHTVCDLTACTSPLILHPNQDQTKHNEGYQDIVFITVKSFDTARAAGDVMPLVGPNTMVISMQNGLSNVETLAGIVGRDRTIGGMAIFGAVMPQPGSVEVTVIASETLVGELDGSHTPRVEAAARILDSAGIPTKVSDNIMQDIWHKALYNIALNPLSALFQVPYGRIADNPHTRWLIEQMISEAFVVLQQRVLIWGWPRRRSFCISCGSRSCPLPGSTAHPCCRISLGANRLRLIISMGLWCDWVRNTGLRHLITMLWCGWLRPGKGWESAGIKTPHYVDDYDRKLYNI